MKTPILVFTCLLLTSCSGWIIQPAGPTPFLPPTPTPSIFTPTPVILSASSPTPVAATATSPSPATETSTPVASDTPGVTPVFSPTPNGPAIAINILGCDTSLDISHGLGEVTNAYVIVSNTGGVELTNVRTTLFALDEGGPHPDKTVQVPLLPAGQQVTLKLTVDSTYRQETPIQVEVVSDQGLFPRAGSAACTEIGLFAPNPAQLKTPVPSVP